MGYALHRDFTLRKTIAIAPLDVRMHLIPSLTTLSVPDCTTSFFLETRHCLLHYMISWMFLRSLQHGIVVSGFLDAFVHAHHKHRRDSANAGNFGDCVSGRVRFMTAITSAYAHAYQTICLGLPFSGVPHYAFRLSRPKSRDHFLPNDRSLSKELGDDYRGWAIFSDGGTRVVDGETVAGWRVISRSPCGHIYVMFGPVITSEAHLAFAGARTHSNNTAEMTAMIEALAFLGPRGPVTPDEQSCIF